MNGSTDPITVGAGDLSLVLSRTADRFRQEVLLATGERRVVLASLEGSHDQDWPPSPPFQEVHIRQDGVHAALLVGRAGRSHWSASIEPDRLQGGILFDIACRSSGKIEWLGSTYCCSGGAVAGGDELRTLQLAGLRLHVLEGRLQLTGEGPASVVTIVPTWTASGAPQTVRWRYRLTTADRGTDAAD